MIIGRSDAFVAVRARLARFATCDAPVLVEGETGTGKELAAREIHYGSARATRPFVPVNCGALPDALVESELFGHRRGAFTDAREASVGLVGHAAGGSLFLDEVDALSAHAQVALLRFLQDHSYRPVGSHEPRVADVRVIAATNADLDALTTRGSFRADLLYRLNPLRVRLPPLRERRGDVPLLARHLLASAVAAMRLPQRRWADAALVRLAAHDWPGNVRELENIALRAALSASEETITLADLVAAEPAFAALPACCEARICDGDGASGIPGSTGRAAESGFRADPTDDLGALSFSAAKSCAIRAFECRYLTDLMQRCAGNVSLAARLSGTERRQLGKLLKKHEIARHRVDGDTPGHSERTTARTT